MLNVSANKATNVQHASISLHYNSVQIAQGQIILILRLR